jgi:hypothetical protein
LSATWWRLGRPISRRSLPERTTLALFGVGGWLSAQQLEPVSVGTHRRPEVRVQAVGDVSLGAQLPETTGDERVDRVGEPGYEVVFDLVIEAAHDPSEHRYPTLDVDGGAQLMHLEVFAATGCVGDGELDAVTQWASWKITARVTPTTHEQIR